MLAILPGAVHAQTVTARPLGLPSVMRTPFCAPASSPERAAMVDLQERIDDIEKRAAESALIAKLATDPETRRYNASLARELRDIAVKLRSQFA